MVPASRKYFPVPRRKTDSPTPASRCSRNISGSFVVLGCRIVCQGFGGGWRHGRGVSRNDLPFEQHHHRGVGPVVEFPLVAAGTKVGNAVSAVS